MKDERLSYRIIGCAMKMHSEIGLGFQEVIYQRALAIELRSAGLVFEREYDMDIIYRGEWPIGQRRVDFLVERVAMLEIKAINGLTDRDKMQVANYCKIYGLPYGLLINFGAPSLEFHRIYNLEHPDNRSFRKPKYSAEIKS